MPGTLNKVILIGRLGQDPKLAHTQTGHPVATFSMATDESYKAQDGTKVDKAEWHRVVVWGKQSEFVSTYLSKGRLVLVEGKLQTREWTDKSQVKRHTTEIIAQRVNALDSKRDGAIPAPTDGDIPPEWDQANQGEIPF
jgi:single-strand DNA-binding protein